MKKLLCVLLLATIGTANAQNFVPGTVLHAADLNTAFGRVNSQNFGTSAPQLPLLGQLWLNTTINPYVLNEYDGSQWIPIGQLNVTSHTWLPPLTPWSQITNTPSTLAGYGITNSINIGTLTYTDTNILGSLQSSVNSFNQFIIQNSNSGNQASADFIVSNNLSSATQYYGDFGINSSTYTGLGSFNLPNATFLTATTGDLAIGTTTANAIHFVVNGGSSDAMQITSGGNIQIGGSQMTFPGSPAVLARTDAGQTFTGTEIFAASSTLTPILQGFNSSSYVWGIGRGSSTNMEFEAATGFNWLCGATGPQTGSSSCLSATNSVVTVPSTLQVTTSTQTGSGVTGLLSEALTTGSYAALYNANVTPSGINYALDTNGTTTNLNGTINSILAVNNTAIATASSTGVAVTGTASATGGFISNVAAPASVQASSGTTGLIMESLSGGGAGAIYSTNVTASSTNFALDATSTTTNVNAATTTNIQSGGTTGIAVGATGTVTLPNIPTSGTITGTPCFTAGGALINQAGANCFAGGGSAVIRNYVVKTTTYTAAVNDAILADTSGGPFTITLPATPAQFATVCITDAAGTFGTNTLTIAGNSSNIMSSSANMTATTPYLSFCLVYYTSPTGWRIM